MCVINLSESLELRNQVEKARELIFNYLKEKRFSENRYIVKNNPIQITSQDIFDVENFLYEELEQLKLGEWGEETIGGIGDSSIVNWTKIFLSQFYKELHDIICIESKMKEINNAADISVKGIVTAIAAWMMNILNITQPLATGIATAVLLILFKATKGAFCNMSKQEVEESLN